MALVLVLLAWVIVKAPVVTLLESVNTVILWAAAAEVTGDRVMTLFGAQLTWLTLRVVAPLEASVNVPFEFVPPRAKA